MSAWILKLLLEQGLREERSEERATDRRPVGPTCWFGYAEAAASLREAHERSTPWACDSKHTAVRARVFLVNGRAGRSVSSHALRACGAPGSRTERLELWRLRRCRSP